MSVNITDAAGIRVALTALALGFLVLIPVGLLPATHRVPVADFSAGDSPADVHIGVLGLFHPIEFTVSAPAGDALVLRADEERMVIEKTSGVDSASVRFTSAGEVVVTSGRRVVRATKIVVSGRRDEPVNLILSVPQKISRHYWGRLEIKPSTGKLIAIVTMDRETAVASVVAAESRPDTPLEALKAQAVAARSYLVASRGRHHEFDFCDTTHCQFLRDPPASGTAAAKATEATRGLVLAYDSRPIAAMYTRSCSGRTHTPAELGFSLSMAAYPYYSVECKHCLEHPARWSSRISPQDATMLRSSDESARLNIDRRIGWNAVPGNDFVVKKEQDEIVLEGTGQGHGIGLCQSGARAMAEEGSDFRQILSHYYPNTTVVTSQ